MSLADQIAAFRQEAEDLIKAVVLQYYFDNSELATPYVPYTDLADAQANIGDNWRPYMTINVAGTEYWYMPNGDLVEKVGSLSLTDKSVTLAKMADMASASLIYRKSSGTGSPEVQSLDTLKTDLGLDGLTAALEAKVDKVANKSLVYDADIAKIHEEGSDIQDLSGLVEKAEGYRLISEEELAGIKQTVFTITLPDSFSVSGRCAAAVEGVDYPTGWVIAADSNPVDLKITHGLERRIAMVTVFSVDGTEERQLFGNAAYSGIVAPTDQILKIESLATIQTAIVIHLIFA